MAGVFQPLAAKFFRRKRSPAPDPKTPSLYPQQRIRGTWIVPSSITLAPRYPHHAAGRPMNRRIVTNQNDANDLHWYNAGARSASYTQ